VTPTHIQQQAQNNTHFNKMYVWEQETINPISQETKWSVGGQKPGILALLFGNTTCGKPETHVTLSRRGVDTLDGHKGYLSR
jgi:hypothetical protein